MKNTIISIITLIFIFGLSIGYTSANESRPIETMAEESSEFDSKYQGYELKRNTYKENDIKIEYPQIVNSNKIDKLDIINNLIKEKAIAAYDDTIKNLENGQTYEVDGEYNIELNDGKILSITFYSYNNIIPSAHPFNKFYTINIDMKTGKEIPLNKVVSNIDDNFIYNLKNGKYVGSIDTIYSTQLFNEVFRYYSDDKELINTIKEAPFYITEDSVGISLAVSHVFGDYANIEVPLSELK